MKIFMAAGSILFLFFLSGVAAAAGDADEGSLDKCAIHDGPCVRDLAGTGVSLDIHPKPVRAMTDLTFTVTLTGRDVAAGGMPYIDLDMPAMRMGPNRVLLTPIGEGVFEGRGVVVRCPSGKKTWRARVTIPDTGTADFIFDVVY